MNADLLAKVIGILAVFGFFSMVGGFLFVSYLLIDRWTTRALKPEPNTNDTLFNAFEEAEKRAKEQQDEERRTAYSRTGISRS